ncbi:DUF2630 family protein [Arthrobacter sp. ISL-30]|nr:DUF2630 family protein [Arthrobacter sp. ISL-30]
MTSCRAPKARRPRTFVRSERHDAPSPGLRAADSVSDRGGRPPPDGTLRCQSETGGSSAVELEERRARLRRVQRGLDECWDMLRLCRVEQVAAEVQGQA